MALMGEGVIAIWNDIRWHAREDFYAWHETEHIPERVAVEGFLRGRRYIRREAEIEYFTLYEARDLDVLKGEAYLARLNAPTPWTRKVVADFYNVTRGLTHKRVSRGRAEGAELLAAAWSVDHGDHTGALAAFVDEAARSEGVCAAHLCATDRAASEVETAERKSRDNTNEVPDLVVLIEASRPAPLIALRRRLEQVTEALDGLKVLRAPGLYRIEFELMAAP